jgi:mannose-6-phosphate isomerase-like protein (cupin superfamily)
VLAVPAQAAFATRNPGEIPAVSLQVNVQLPQLLTPMTDRLGDASDSGDVHSERVAATIALPPGIPAAITLGRIILPPGGSIVVNRTGGPALVILERGLLGATRDGREVERASGDAELVPSGEWLTIRSTGDEPLASLLLTIAPAESTEAFVPGTVKMWLSLEVAEDGIHLRATGPVEIRDLDGELVNQFTFNSSATRLGLDWVEPMATPTT